MSQMADPINIKLFLVSTYPVMPAKKLCDEDMKQAFMCTFSIPEVSHHDSEKHTHNFSSSTLSPHEF